MSIQLKYQVLGNMKSSKMAALDNSLVENKAIYLELLLYILDSFLQMGLRSYCPCVQAILVV